MALYSTKSDLELESQVDQTSLPSSTKLDNSQKPQQIIQEREGTINLTDWDGPDDPENPLNWSLFSRSLHLFVPAALMAAVTLGSSVYMPGYLDVMKQFHVSSTVALLPFTTYVLGLSFGPVLGAPISETHGRKVVFLFCTPIYALFVVGCGLANNITALIILRFLAGMFGSPPVAVGAGSGAELSTPETRGTLLALIALMGLLGPTLGPLVGTPAAVHKGWRWTQWTLLFFIAVAYIGVFFTKETYKKIIIARRRKRAGAESLPSPSGLAALKILVMVTLTRPIHMLFVEPIVAALSIYVAFNFATIYSFFVVFPYAFLEVYSFTAEQTGLTFISLVLGILIGGVINILCDLFIYRRHLRRLQQLNSGRKIAPEMRLHSAMIGSVLAPVGLFWFGWTAKSNIHWICPLIGGVLVAAGNATIFTGVALYLVDTYEATLGASALAANGILRYIVGACLPLSTLPMYQHLHVDWATSLLAFIALAMVPLPWCFFTWGHHLRLRSRYQTAKV